MSDVPDPVFAEEMVGPGVAIEPDPGRTTVVSPIAGKVLKVLPHAFVVLGDGVGVLVHLGINTVQLGGEGFTLLVGEGDQVDAGQVLVTWDPAAVDAGGRSPVCPVVALDGQPDALSRLVEPGDDVTAGAPFLEWA